MQTYHWQGQKHWQSARMSSGARHKHWWLIGIASVFIGLAMPALLAIPEELNKGNWAILCVLLFPLFGLGLLFTAARDWLAWRRYGDVFVHMSPWPGAIGGAVAGHIEFSAALPEAHEIGLTLQCLHQQRGRKKSGTSTRWMRELMLQPLSPYEQQAWFHFPLPDDLPPCSARKGSFHQWILTLRVRQPGADLVRRFDIPVFAGLQDNPTAQRKMRVIEPRHDETITRKLNVIRRPDGISMTQPAGHAWKLACGLLVFGLSCALPTWLLWHEGGLAVVMALIFGACTAVLLPCALWTLGVHRKILLTREQFAVRLYWFMLPITTRREPRSAIRGLNWTRSGSSQTGTRSTVYYRLHADLNNGKELDLCRGLAGIDYTESVARLISRETGIELTG